MRTESDGQDSIAHLTSHDKHVAVGRASRPARATTSPRRGSGHWALAFLLEAKTTGRPPALFRAELLQEPHPGHHRSPPTTSNFSRAQFFSSIRAVGREKIATQQARVVAGDEVGRRRGWSLVGRSEGGEGTAGERI